jgi:HSP20 family molecular chaperone IbpA
MSAVMSGSSSFTLPQNVDEQKVNAKLENGCLMITLNESSHQRSV